MGAPGARRARPRSGAGTLLLLGGRSTWGLRPGATTWEPLPIRLDGATRASDGRIYARSLAGIVRLEADDTATPLATCERVQVRACFAPQLGADPAGRIYLGVDARLHVYDPALDQLDLLEVPGGRTLSALLVTDRHVFLAGRSESAPFAVLAMPPDAGADLARVHDQSGDHVEDNFRFAIDPAGTVYATHGDWLGRLVETP